MKRLAIILALIAALTCVATADAKPLNLNQILDATCRVSTGKSYGSGTCIDETKDSYLVLTNAHVVGSSRSVTAEFFKMGRKTYPIRGEVIWKAYRKQSDMDFAIIKLAKNDFGQYPPRIIPIAPRGYKIKKGDYIASAGCPRAAWATAWEGYVLGFASNSRVWFTPPPLGGQSGSGVMVLVPDKRGELHTRVGAVLTYRLGESYKRDSQGRDYDKGGAIPATTLHNALSNTVSYTEAQAVPAHWKPCSTERVVPGDYWGICDVCGNYYGLHAKCSGGRLWCKNQDMQTLYKPLPHGAHIVHWNWVDNCPNGSCSPYGRVPRNPPSGWLFGGRRRPVPPRNPGPGQRPPDPGTPQPPGGGGNPYGGSLPPDIIPPWPGDEKPEDETKPEIPIPEEKPPISEPPQPEEKPEPVVPEKNEEVEKLEAQVNDLKTQIQALSGEIDRLRDASKADKAKVTELEQKVADRAKLQAKLLDTEKELGKKETELADAKSEAEIANVKNEELEGDVLTLEGVKAELAAELVVAVQETKTSTGQRNWLAAILALLSSGFLGSLAYRWWMGGGRIKLRGVVDEAQERADVYLSKVLDKDAVDFVHREIDVVQKYVGDRVEAYLKAKNG